jgi:hypothetical protein
VQHDPLLHARSGLRSLCVCVCVHRQATSSSSSRGPHTAHCVVPTQEFASRARCTALLNLWGETEFEIVSLLHHACTHSRALAQPLHCMAAHPRRVAAPCNSRHCRCLLEKTLTSHGSFLSAHRAPGSRRSRSMSHRLMLLQGACTTHAIGQRCVPVYERLGHWLAQSLVPGTTFCLFSAAS